MIFAIVAVDNNWGIGFNGELLEHIPEDMQYFKKLTENNTVLMGRKTWDSLPTKPLLNRWNIVLTNSASKQYISDYTLFTTLEQQKSVIDFVSKSKDINWYIIGGGQIYKELLPYCSKVFVTKVFLEHHEVDTYFPNLDNSLEWWIENSSEKHMYNGIEYAFLTYERR